MLHVHWQPRIANYHAHGSSLHPQAKHLCCATFEADVFGNGVERQVVGNGTPQSHSGTGLKTGKPAHAPGPADSRVGRSGG